MTTQAEPVHLGVLIRKERKRRGWSQDQLAAEFGLTQPAVAQWESKTTTPDLTRWRKVAEFLGLPEEVVVRAILDSTNPGYVDFALSAA